MFVLYTRPNTKSSIFLQFFRIFLQSFFDFIYFYAILCKYSLLFTLFMHNMDFGAELCIFCSVLPFPFVYIFKNIQINVDYMQYKFGLSQRRNGSVLRSATCMGDVHIVPPPVCTDYRMHCRGGSLCPPAKQSHPPLLRAGLCRG